MITIYICVTTPLLLRFVTGIDFPSFFGGCDESTQLLRSVSLGKMQSGFITARGFGEGDRWDLLFVIEWGFNESLI